MSKSSEIAVTRAEFKFADGAQPGTFSGYGAVFGNVDSQGDLIEKGAFAATLRDWKKAGRLPPMLAQHGGFLGSDLTPIGVWTSMQEDDRGLKVYGRLINLDTDAGKRIYGAMREGALDGLSIGYQVTDYATGARKGDPRRTIKSLNLVELSVVTMPANDQARIDRVKSLQRGDLEEVLHRYAGMSRSEARKFVAAGWPALRSAPDDGPAHQLLARLEAATAALRKTP